jgi:hypothetical protein
MGPIKGLEPLEIPEHRIKRNLTLMYENIYLNNKYTKTYWRIIYRAQNRPKLIGYKEKHHIYPESITDLLKLTKSKTVPLTYREHRLVHHLLLRMTTGKMKALMWYAYEMTCCCVNGNQTGRILNTKESERVKLAYIDSIFGENSPRYGKNPWNKGKKDCYSEETRKRISEGGKGKHGGPKSEEHKKKTADTLSLTWQIIYPNGTIKIIKNLKQFCRDNNLSQGCMSLVAQGKQTPHKGFKCIKIISDQ